MCPRRGARWWRPRKKSSYAPSLVSIPIPVLGIQRVIARGFKGLRIRAGWRKCARQRPRISVRRQPRTNQAASRVLKRHSDRHIRSWNARTSDQGHGRRLRDAFEYRCRCNLCAGLLCREWRRTFSCIPTPQGIGSMTIGQIILMAVVPLGALSMLVFTHFHAKFNPPTRASLTTAPTGKDGELLGSPPRREDAPRSAAQDASPRVSYKII